MPGRKLSEDARREDILRAAYDVAARRGLSALTLRAVAQRAKVSHGTVLFHFRRRSELVAALLDRVLYATAILRVPYSVENVTRPADRLRELLRSEMERLSTEARHFRLFLDYWTLGVRSAPLRKRIGAALDAYRMAWRTLGDQVVVAEHESRVRRRADQQDDQLAPEGVAAVAVSLVHGCALQALIDPKGFEIEQHFEVAARMLDGIVTAPAAMPRFGTAARGSPILGEAR